MRRLTSLTWGLLVLAVVSCDSPRTIGPAESSSAQPDGAVESIRVGTVTFLVTWDAVFVGNGRRVFRFTDTSTRRDFLAAAGAAQEHFNTVPARTRQFALQVAPIPCADEASAAIAAWEAVIIAANALLNHPDLANASVSLSEETDEVDRALREMLPLSRAFRDCVCAEMPTLHYCLL
jgi:hypothetical protein